MEKILNVLLRVILGTLAMFFVNTALEEMGVFVGVGINGVTVLTAGILGFPGLLALYGYSFYKSL